MGTRHGIAIFTSMALLWQGAAAFAVTRDDRYSAIPGTRVRMIRPDGFEVGEGFQGWIQAQTLASLAITEVPGPFSEVTAGFLRPENRPRGMRLLTQEDVTVDGKPALLFKVRLTVQDIPFLRWIIAVGDESHTTLIMAAYPEFEAERFSGMLRATVLGAKIDDKLRPESEEDRGFTIQPSEKIPEATSMAGMRAYTRKGGFPSKSPKDPLFVVGRSISTVDTKERRGFALARLYQTAEVAIGLVEGLKPITIDGLEGYECEAASRDVESGTPMHAYQVILFIGDSYFLMQGLVGAGGKDEFLPEFKAMARSFKRSERTQPVAESAGETRFGETQVQPR